MNDCVGSGNNANGGGLWADCITPDWDAPANVRALVTTRAGGVSAAPWAGLNLGLHVGDDPAAVAENRRRLRACLPAEPVWLHQVHGTTCIAAAQAPRGAQADAAWTDVPGVVCAVLTADCLPVFFCDAAGARVAVAHAGWRGLLDGVLESTVASLRAAGAQELMAWIGPGIGPQAFEVGGEVRDAYLAHDTDAAAAFVRRDNGRWLADLPQLATQRLRSAGLRRIATTVVCTYGDAERFYSYRRDGVTGRMASCIWLAW